jgi:hypothetical protein
MRKTLLALAATTGLLSLGSAGASALTLGAQNTAAQPGHAAIQQADWGCGPNCEYWRHRHWVERHRSWRHEHYPYYGYNSGYRGYR